MNKKKIYIKGDNYMIKFFEFNTNTYSEIWESLQMYVPTKYVNAAQGILATGNFTNAPWLKRV